MHPTKSCNDSDEADIEKVASPTLSEVEAMFDDITLQVATLTESIEQ